MSRVFVSGLSPYTKDKDLKNFFEDAIDVRRVIDVTNSYFYKSAFLTFENDEKAELAIKKNGEILLDHKINVNLA